MSDFVKSGQVWTQRTGGATLTIVREDESNDYDWIVSDSKGLEWTVPEWRLHEDYVLVKEAP